MRLRRPILLIHRWLGLASAAILVIVGLTGGALLFGPDLPLRRVFGAVHQTLGLGRAGLWIVLVATAVSVLLQFSGAVLWWKRKTLVVRRQRDWLIALDDLHHALGAVMLPLMFVIAVTGLALSVSLPQPVGRTVGALHAAGPFPWPVKVLYFLASSAFAVQGVTGVVMWWAKFPLPVRRQRV